MHRTKLITIAVIVFLCMIIVLQNTEPVETHFLFFTITMPRAVFIVGTTSVGFVLGVLTSLFLVRKQSPRRADRTDDTDLTR